VPQAELPAAFTGRLHPIHLDHEYRQADYDFLTPAIAGRSIVQLGESIHVTTEMPQARLRLARYLHEQAGFDVIGFEGSWMDAWLAQDVMLHAKDPLAAAREGQEIAWFNLWQTRPMLEVIQYVASTSHSANPLYLASFDIQTGRPRRAEDKSENTLEKFFEVLNGYGARISPGTAQRWIGDLSGYLNCGKDLDWQPGSAGLNKAQAAIGEIEAAIVNIRNEVERQSVAMHARALAHAAIVLRQNLQLCEATRGEINVTYTELRDSLNAQNVGVLRNSVSATHRVMVWAHHSHVYYDSEGKRPLSMGHALRQSYGPEVFTVGLFAKAGTAIDTVKADRAGLAGFVGAAPRRIRPAEELGVEQKLATLSTADYFLALPAEQEFGGAWAAPSSSRFEPWGRRTVSLVRDFDAAVFLARVSPADLLFVPRPVSMALRSIGFGLDHLGAAAALLAVALCGVFTAGRVRWRARRERARSISSDGRPA
jgi:erythromycin esterase